DDLHAGRTPRAKSDGLTIRDLANRFLTSKKLLLDGGELSPHTFKDYHETSAILVDQFDGDRLVDDLRPEDFDGLRAYLADRYGPVRLKTTIQRVRTMLRFAYDSYLLEKPIRYGPGFKAPSRRVILKAQRENGSRMFEPHEIRAMLDAASPQLKAMILLGINAGFGNHDVAALTTQAIDLDEGWVIHPRPKTQTERRCSLWPETIEALRTALETRPKPEDRKHKDLIFITSHGNAWAQTTSLGNWRDTVGTATLHLLTRLKLKRPRLSFYALRHTFRTIADETRDQPAIDFIMGHVRNDMASVYRERISDDRLRAVTDYVRQWLYEGTSTG
ncbi:MAG: tyrosine-type recombinase/integrase, partial [Planctomycetota bacterium]